MGVGRFISNQVLKGVTGGKVRRANRIYALLRLPVLLRLGYALFRDERIPRWQRSAVLALLALIFSPLDFVGNIPVVGQFWDFTLAIVVLEYFIRLSPPEVVNEHIKRLRLEKKVPLRRV
jgi:uncharacterized membrane protein YkvA (DUF1232 family)